MSNNVKALLDLAAKLGGPDDMASRTALESPSVPEMLGSQLAKLLAAEAPDAIVVWERPATAVLGHVVARDLSADLVHAFAEEGILGLTTELPSGTSAAIVSYDWAEYPGLEALVNLLTSRGISVVGIGSVLTPSGAREVNGLAVVSLVAAASDHANQEPR